MFNIDEQYETELNNFKEGHKYDVTIIAEHLATMLVAYGSTKGTYYEDRNKDQVLKVAVDGVPAILQYIHQEELYKTNVIAAYADANKRKTEADKDKLFWKLAAFNVGLMVMIYLAYRFISRLHPYFGTMVEWLEHAGT